MKRWKKGLAGLLAAVMLISLMPLASAATVMGGEEVAETAPVEAQGTAIQASVRPAVTTVEQEQAEALSLLPLEEKWIDVDLQTQLPMELGTVKVADVLASEIKSEENPDGTLDGTEQVAWCIRSEGEYFLTDMNGTMDLSSMRSYSSCTLEMIVGSGKQLDGDSTRYLVDVDLYNSYSNWLVPTIYKQDAQGARTEVTVKRTNYWADEPSEMYVMANSGTMEYRDEVYMGLAINEDLATDYDLKIYAGDESEYISGSAEDVTEQMLDQDMTQKDAGYKANFAYDERYFTIELLDGETVIAYESFMLYVDIAWTGVSYSYLRGDRISGGGYESVVYRNQSSWDSSLKTYVYTYTLYKEFPASGEYYQNLDFCLDGDYFGASNTGFDELNILAVKGYYDTRAAAESAIQSGRATDITQELFGYPGHKCSFSSTVVFSIFQGDEVYHEAFRAQNGTVLKYPPVEDEGEGDGLPEKVGSSDTYFRVNGAVGANVYVMPYEHDAYYTNGYQTVLVLEGEEAVDLSTLKPTFYAGTDVKMYAGEPPVEQTTGESVQDFSTDAVRYSASAGDKEHVKNYVVTFVKSDSTGPKIFVNGANAEKESDGSVRRELFLNTYQGNYHDIFIANVGNEPLTGLKAELSADAQNVKLDDYWTVGGEGNSTLAAFTTTSTPSGRYYGELYNVAKIRLVPDGTGEVGGKLTISADGQEDVVFTLTGSAGDPVITTKRIPLGVKYVPYGTMIQNSNMYDWNTVTYSIYRGKLPEGVELMDNGEIYGVPVETGEFIFTVKLENSVSAFDDSYATYTLVVEENTDENVDAQTDEGYSIQVRVEDFETTYENREFKIEGELGEFIDLWLDGEKLVAGRDYTAEEGSTKTTIFSKTFRGAGTGQHTLAAEFRVDGDVNKDLKKAAQNYNSTAPKGTSGYRPSGSSSTLHDIAEKQPEPEPETVAKPQAKDAFRDVSATAWYYDDVNWGYQNDLLLGVGNALYDPDGKISQSMVTTLLARIGKVELSQYNDVTDTTVEANQWYTNAAVWAWKTGMIPASGFEADPPFARGELAVMLVKYLDYMAVKYGTPDQEVVFADADQMTAEQNGAFQVLYAAGIFKGVGGNYMAPDRATSRAELATLFHRLSDYLSDK